MDSKICEAIENKKIIEFFYKRHKLIVSLIVMVFTKIRATKFLVRIR